MLAPFALEMESENADASSCPPPRLIKGCQPLCRAVCSPEVRVPAVHAAEAADRPPAAAAQYKDTLYQ